MISKSTSFKKLTSAPAENDLKEEMNIAPIFSFEISSYFFLKALCHSTEGELPRTGWIDILLRRSDGHAVNSRFLASVTA